MVRRITRRVLAADGREGVHVIAPPGGAWMPSTSPCVGDGRAGNAHFTGTPSAVVEGAACASWASGGGRVSYPHVLLTGEQHHGDAEDTSAAMADGEQPFVRLLDARAAGCDRGRLLVRMRAIGVHATPRVPPPRVGPLGYVRRTSPRPARGGPSVLRVDQGPQIERPRYAADELCDRTRRPRQPQRATPTARRSAAAPHGAGFVGACTGDHRLGESLGSTAHGSPAPALSTVRPNRFRGNEAKTGCGGRSVELRRSWTSEPAWAARSARRAADTRGGGLGPCRRPRWRPAAARSREGRADHTR